MEFILANEKGCTGCTPLVDNYISKVVVELKPSSLVEDEYYSFKEEVELIISNYEIDKTLNCNYNFSNISKYLSNLDNGIDTMLMANISLMCKFLSICSEELVYYETHPDEDVFIENLSSIAEAMLNDLKELKEKLS